MKTIDYNQTLYTLPFDHCGQVIYDGFKAAIAAGQKGKS
jgi:hypothetical protein